MQILTVLAVVLAALLSAAPGAAQSCATCHEDQAKKLPGTAHAQQDCANCHPGHEKLPHPKSAGTLTCGTCHSTQADQAALGVHDQARQHGNLAAPECGTCHGSAHEVALPGTTPFRRHVAETCGMCHSDQAGQFKASVHGQAVVQGVREAPVCTDCHGEHAILKPSSPAARTNAAHVRETCSHCHGDVRLTAKFGLPPDRVLSYEASFHGLAAKAGSQSVANCGSCHGVHLILPSSDARSSINAKNLPATCGGCHPGAGTRFALGPVHVDAAPAEPSVVEWARRIYVILIFTVIGLMALHNGGDWVRKVRGRLAGALAARAAAPGEFRMYPAERLQHALLVASFTVLVWTGFALKYPTEFWARPLVAWENSWPVRGTVHRIAGAVFLATSLLHALLLISSARLREHWKDLWPRRSDVAEALAGFAYNLGLRREKPALARHSYVEKAEYWAVVWGAVIMGGTGLMLWANTFFLAWLPKTALDLATVVHFYEAVLATLAILVWHFYFVIFDPDVYPLDSAWLNGYSPRQRRVPSRAAPVAEPQEEPPGGPPA